MRILSQWLKTELIKRDSRIFGTKEERVIATLYGCIVRRALKSPSLLKNTPEDVSLAYNMMNGILLPMEQQKEGLFNKIKKMQNALATVENPIKTQKQKEESCKLIISNLQWKSSHDSGQIRESEEVGAQIEILLRARARARRYWATTFEIVEPAQLQVLSERGLSELESEIRGSFGVVLELRESVLAWIRAYTSKFDLQKSSTKPVQLGLSHQMKRVGLSRQMKSGFEPPDEITMLWINVDSKQILSSSFVSLCGFQAIESKSSQRLCVRNSDKVPSLNLSPFADTFDWSGHLTTTSIKLAMGPRR
ncbi:hypothetical protein Scep_009735 [Stephania cephalantha]|uniref:Uncharacterized protein n=1 Tax=Stephania cephalantha TaxID=152367 RepID=A0AAP0JUE3_9MAGN